jgi:hypothetical protein
MQYLMNLLLRLCMTPQGLIDGIMHLQASSSGVPVLRNHQKLPTMTCKLLKFCNKTIFRSYLKPLNCCSLHLLGQYHKIYETKCFPRLISILTLVTDSFNTSFSKTRGDFDVFLSHNKVSVQPHPATNYS